MLKFHLFHIVEYSLLGTFAAGVVIWIFHTLILGNSVIEWNYALIAGVIFGFYFSYLHRNDHHPDYPH